MADKLKDLEMRIDRMESRLKATFLEIERKFEEAKLDQPVVLNIEERLQELEDLLLLLQLEITKLKEKTGVDVDFGTTPTPQRDIDERLRRLEESHGSGTTYMEPKKDNDTDKKIAYLEATVEELKESITNSHLDYKNASSIGKELDEIEKRLERLESSRPMAARQSVLEDVRKILES